MFAKRDRTWSLGRFSCCYWSERNLIALETRLERFLGHLLSIYFLFEARNPSNVYQKCENCMCAVGPKWVLFVNSVSSQLVPRCRSSDHGTLFSVLSCLFVFSQLCNASNYCHICMRLEIAQNPKSSAVVTKKAFRTYIKFKFHTEKRLGAYCRLGIFESKS